MGLGLAVLWSVGKSSQIVLAGAFAVFGASSYIVYGDRPETGADQGTRGPGATPGDWPLEHDEVTLPGDWADRTSENYHLFRKQPEGVREGLADLARWERIVLTLDGAPEREGLPPYERTTPGLHFLTHCPYSNIGPEIDRANERAESILEDFELETGSGMAYTDPDLVEGRLGRAEGLDSPRVKIYELTDVGERVAARLRDELGLGDEDPTEVERLVAEGFGDRPQS